MKYNLSWALLDMYFPETVELFKSSVGSEILS